MSNSPKTVLVRYQPKPGQETALLALVRAHHPVLTRIGLAGPMQPQLWTATDKRSGGRALLELFQWRDAAASELAHHTPEVMAVWESMGPLLESMSISELEPVAD
ncbi:MAG: hypothetical protein IT370_33145 [Deltaproteobacteria bacterium]|nr:hypothetical protein [Deltaproteobacteria bacterium]